MSNANTGRSESPAQAGTASSDAVPQEAQGGSTAAQAGEGSRPDPPATPKGNPAAGTSSPQSMAGQPSPRWRRWLIVCAGVAGVAVAAYFVYPVADTMVNTVSTDDAYVNGHVTFVAPRVSGQVARVLVEDNYRVKKGALLVQLDQEPYQVQVAIKQAAVQTAEADLVAAEAEVRSLVAQTRAYRFQLDRAIEDVHNQIANLRANVATLESRRAVLARARADHERAQQLFARGAIAREEFDRISATYRVAEADVLEAREQVSRQRVALGLPAEPSEGHGLADVPPDLDQNFSTVRQALEQLTQSAAQFGYFPTSWNATPKQVIAAFYKQDPEGNLDKILARLIPMAPAIKQAEAKLLQAQRDLAQANLDLRYCDIVSEIDGVVTRRNVNPGNHVQVGQSLMAVRSLSEIWIDANFKETQLADLRIGQRVRCDVDMYGSRRHFEGRITGFTMGTGQTLALLPPQNATGNFVKIVQRLPVRIELTNYEPDKNPLFVGLSVVPHVYYKQRPTGPHAGQVLQPAYPLPIRPMASGPGESSPPVATPGPVPSSSVSRKPDQDPQSPSSLPRQEGAGP